MAKSKVLILGAGPAGLTVASKLGKNAVVLEQSEHVGGLSQSIEFCGATFDIGGHSFHTPHTDVRTFVESFMGGKMVTQERDARVQFGDQLLAYPFQHSFRSIRNVSVVAECEAHEPDTQAIAQSAHFEEWIERRFGNGIARHFMLPYNRKLWARDLSTMSCEWVVERIATEPSADDVSADRRQPLQSDSLVSYPQSGGFGEIFEELARNCHSVLRGQEVVSVDARSKTAVTRAGMRWSWENLVTTLPLPVFLDMLENCDSDIRQLAAGLESVSMKILLLSVGQSSVETPQRVYSADASVHGHKIAFNHTSSPSLRAREKRGVMCEVSHSDTKPVPSNATMIDDTWTWLRDSGLVSPAARLEGAKVIDLKYGYPVYTPSRPRIVDEISGYLQKLGIHSIGRFGSWAYVNSDACIRQGLDLVKSSFPDFQNGEIAEPERYYPAGSRQ